MNLRQKIDVPADFAAVELNDLPKYSPWPARLLGLTEWTPRDRKSKLVLREYKDKWGGIMEYYESQKFTTLSEALQNLFNYHFPPHMLFHIDEYIYYAENNNIFWDFIYGLIRDALCEYLKSDDTLVELGCGWGRNLFYALNSSLCSKVIGGEYTEDGIRLGRHISANFGLQAEFYHFDYYNPALEFLRKLKNTVVFSHNSIEQIAHMPEETISSLAESGPKAVIHFEPIYEYRSKDTLLHNMWKRYTEINDYNRNLITVLKGLEKRGFLKITAEKIHAFGLNAFNPGSIIIWEPR